ncbi:MAG: ECF transporter S component [Candidatus Hodarchaeota archaeon]
MEEESKDREIQTSEIPPTTKIPWINGSRVKKRRKTTRYYETSDLVIIALFSALGGIFSTFIGYLGNLLNHIIGVPFGGGQILGGLHVFWIVLIYLLTKQKVGAALMAGILKGFVEFFSGSAHGILVVVLSGTQGLIIEIFIIIFLSTQNKSILSLAAGFSSLSNVIIQQILFFNSQIPILFIVFIGFLSFISGFFLGGLFAISTWKIFERSDVLNWRKTPSDPSQLKQIQILRIIIVIVIVVSEIGVFYLFAVQNRYSAEVSGDVFNPYTYYHSDFLDLQITVEANLTGDVTYVPPKNYTGVPLYNIVERAQPKTDNFIVQLSASDGYQVEFSGEEIDQDRSIIVTSTEIGLRIVAKNFHGSFWIEKVKRIEIRSI